MTSVQPRIDDLTSVEPEFEKACESVSGCDNRAEWYLWSRHAINCPQTFHMCTPCKERCESNYSAALKIDGQVCNICNEPFAGNLSDQLRFIKL